MPQPEIAELVRPDLQRELSRYESSRITFRWREKPIGRKELPKWVQEAPGPRLLILNTVQSAAVIAADMAAEFGQTHVEHLSTALTPEDRGNTIDRIRRRLADPDDADWTLVATSCVEAGVVFPSGRDSWEIPRASLRRLRAGSTATAETRKRS